MIATADTTNYFDFLSRRNWTTWLWSGLVAFGLNLVMFLFLPHMTDPTPPPASLTDVIPHVNVIRVKRPEKEVRHRPFKPPEPPKVKPKRTPQRAPILPMPQKLALPLELSPPLTAGPDSLELPAWQSVPLSDVGAFPSALDVGQLDGPLTTVARIPPVYPLRARRRGIEGWVKVAFIVDETGRVEDVTIVEAEPPGVFENSVEQCVRSWRFNPGTVEGVPVRARAETTIRFELQ